MTKRERTRALLHLGAAALVIAVGVAAAVARFPSEFDWVYMVISKLVSRTHNPGGALWLSASLLTAVCLVWPVIGLLDRSAAREGARPRAAIAALRLGLLGAGVLALEGVLSLDLSRLNRKAHELVALITFLSFYGGVLGLYIHRIRRSASFLWPALLVLLPLCAVALSQFALYFDQRDLGWVNTSWRDMGIPFWLSFAFWQWSAAALLGVGLGFLVAVRDARPVSDPARLIRPLRVRPAGPAARACPGRQSSGSRPGAPGV